MVELFHQIHNDPSAFCFTQNRSTPISLEGHSSLGITSLLQFYICLVCDIRIAPKTCALVKNKAETQSNDVFRYVYRTFILCLPFCPIALDTKSAKTNNRPARSLIKWNITLDGLYNAKIIPPVHGMCN
jgi:hypothetical protein